MIALLTTLALVLSIIGAWRIASRLALELPPFGRGALAGALVVALMLVPLALVGRATHRLDHGIVAWLVAAAVLVVAERWSARRSAPVPPLPRSPLLAGVVLSTAVMLAIYAVLALQYQMHDEHSIFGHKSMVEELRAGEYPPYFPPTPDHDARYHYGFDVVAGVLARAYDLSSDAAIDVTMLALMVLLSWAAAALVADAGAPRAAPFAAIAIHLGAGMSWLTLAGVEGRHPRCLIQYHHPSCGVELFPTPILNLFQHPVSVGVPLVLVCWVIAHRLVDDRTARDPVLGSPGTWRWALLLLLLLPALALGQIVYFALGLLGAIAGAVATRRWRGTLRLVLVALVGLGLARLAGGMLEPTTLIDPGLMLRRHVIGFPKPELVPIVRHHLANLGVGMIVLPVVGLIAVVRRNFLVSTLAAFATGGVLVFHLYTYTRSWDIVKFPSASAFALTLLYVVAVDARLAGGGVLRPWLRRGGRALLLGSGLLAVVWLLWPLHGDRRLYDVGHRTADTMVARVIEGLRAHGYQRRELVLAQSNIATELAVFGGISVVATDGDLYTMGIKQELLSKQERLANRARATLDRTALDELGVRWLVYSDEELRNLGPAAQRTLTSSATTPEFREVARFEGEQPERRRRIWRVE